MWSRAHRLTRLGAGAPSRWLPNGKSHETRPARGTGGGFGTPAGAPDPPALAPEDAAAALIADAYARGRAEGRLEAERGMAAERERLARTIDQVGGLRPRVLAEAERDVADMAVSVARRILHREVRLDPDILLAMARVALGRLGDRVAATVYLHPADHAAVSGRTADTTLVLASDPDLPRAGCRIASALGDIDLGIDAQVTELARILIDDGAGGSGVVHAVVE